MAMMAITTRSSISVKAACPLVLRYCWGRETFTTRETIEFLGGGQMRRVFGSVLIYWSAAVSEGPAAALDKIESPNYFPFPPPRKSSASPETVAAAPPAIIQVVRLRGVPWNASFIWSLKD